MNIYNRDPVEYKYFARIVKVYYLNLNNKKTIFRDFNLFSEIVITHHREILTIIKSFSQYWKYGNNRLKTKQTLIYCSSWLKQ